MKKFFKEMFYEFWSGTTVKTSDKVSFELGGFVLCLWVTILLLWGLGIIEPK
jgi:hypothetical protein